jgi:hypothetical protein
MVDSPLALYIGKEGGVDFDHFTRAGQTPFGDIPFLARQ